VVNEEGPPVVGSMGLLRAMVELAHHPQRHRDILVDLYQKDACRFITVKIAHQVFRTNNNTVLLNA
jgi:hypothetical protein